jgi:hypothetical protein
LWLRDCPRYTKSDAVTTLVRNVVVAICGTEELGWVTVRTAASRTLVLLRHDEARVLAIFSDATG